MVIEWQNWDLDLGLTDPELVHFLLFHLISFLVR